MSREVRVHEEELRGSVDQEADSHGALVAEDVPDTRRLAL
jgi:hypothetical protein